MTDPIVHLYYQRPVDKPDQPKTVQPDPNINGPSFSNYMKDQINRVNDQQLEAAKSIEELATGQRDDIGQVMASVEKSNIAFGMLVEVRNKLLEAYQEVMRMPV